MDEDIYEDLDNFMLEEHVGQVQENSKELQQTIEKLEETTKKFTEEISELKKINHNLERNISALFKTAKNEIERKDKKIAELRRELDNLKFKRGNKKGGAKCDENNDDSQKELEKCRCAIEQKNRIIQSLTKELDGVKKELTIQEKNMKRNASHFENDDLRNRLGKKRKLDDGDNYKRDKTRRPRSRSKSRFDKKRTLRRHRSGSFEQRRNSIIEKHRNKNETKYSKSRSRSPVSHKKYINGRINSQHPDKISKVRRSRSRSSSNDHKKYNKHEKSEILDRNIKCEKKTLVNNHLLKEDSGMSSSNSHTSELIIKCDEVKSVVLLENLKSEDLEEGEIDCSLEDIDSDEDNFVYKQKTKIETKKPENKTIYKIPERLPPIAAKKIVMNKENKVQEDFKDAPDVLELMVQSNYLDDLDIDEEITKMRMLDDTKRKKRKEDKARISKLRNAISECKQNIELLEHNFSSEEETETEDELNKTGLGFCANESVVNGKQSNNLVLKISKGSIVKASGESKTVDLKNDVVLDANLLDNKVQNDVLNTLDLKQKQTQKLGEVLDVNTNKKEMQKELQKPDETKNALDTINKKETHKPTEVLDKIILETNKKEKQKPDEDTINKTEKLKPNDVVILETNKKEVNNKSVKEIKKNSKVELKDTDNQIKVKTKPLEDDKRKKRDTSKNVVKTTTTTTNVQQKQQDDKVTSTKTENVDFKANICEPITETELLQAINNIIVDDVKIDGTNIESDVDSKKPVEDVLECKLKEIFDVEHEKKENVASQSQMNKNEATSITKSEAERKAPLKAKRRRAFICIT